ncbi:MAG: hypothetical protein H8E85_01495 [Candidatus Marinimicrobia bacterium]|nr:hypothetical protein [Candidatus Neomarinimicrobiota bacterium]
MTKAPLDDWKEASLSPEELSQIFSDSPEFKYERREIEDSILEKITSVLKDYHLDEDVRNKIEYLSSNLYPYTKLDDVERKNLSKTNFLEYRTRIENIETRLKSLLGNPDLYRHLKIDRDFISKKLNAIIRFQNIDKKHRAGTMEPLEIPLNVLFNSLKYDVGMKKHTIINYVYELCVSFEFGNFGRRSDDSDIQTLSDKEKRKQLNADKREDIDVVEKWYDRYGYSSIQFIFI